MDLKNIFQQKGRGNQASGNLFQRGTQNMRGGEAGRKTGEQKSHLNRFKKKTVAGTAPAGQFKKYMLEANNVFFENRPQLKKMQDLKSLRWGLLLIWFILALSYFLIGRLQAYKGVCPKHARCGVFIHCAQYFEFDQNSGSCVLSSDIVNEIKDISEAQVIQLQYNYGDNECAGIDVVPTLNIDYLFSDLEDLEKKRHYQSSAKTFFTDTVKQQQLGFTLDHNIVEPTVKLYTFSCKVNKFLSNPHRQLDMFYAFLGLVAVLIIAYWITKKRRVSKMYQFLRERVLAAPDETLNVTHAMADLEGEFGQIDEQTWLTINEIRAKGKQIGFYEDDFLYWKKM